MQKITNLFLLFCPFFMAETLPDITPEAAIAHAIANLENQGKYTYAKTYISLRSSLQRFGNFAEKPVKDLLHSDIEAYSAFLADAGLRASTISFYLRALRAVCNKHTRCTSIFQNIAITEKCQDKCKEIKAIDPDSNNWYAAKFFLRDYEKIRRLVQQTAEDTYIPMVTVATKCGSKIIQRTRPLCSLIFFHAAHSAACRLTDILRDKAMVYTTAGTTGKHPAVIPEKEMKMFRIITSATAPGIEYYPDDLPKFREGERVRVIAGDFEGAEGTIVRIKKDRRLVVTITGVCAVATPHLPQEFLMSID